MCSLYADCQNNGTENLRKRKKKVADCIVEGRPSALKAAIFGFAMGRVTIADEMNAMMQTYYEQYKIDKGYHIMRIAVTYENGEIFQHFRHTEQFKIYDVQDGNILSFQVVDTNGSGHGALAGVLNALNADVLIRGGIGGGAQAAFSGCQY
ncbi:MAG: NifB/NifX family molybdenum-iron cluster-binding protein [Enterocloster sp.]